MPLVRLDNHRPPSYRRIKAAVTLVRATAVPGLTPRLVARNAVCLLNLADQLVMSSFDFHARIARSPSPPLLQSSRQLREMTSSSIQIHRPLLVDRRCVARTQGVVAVQHACQHNFQPRNQCDPGWAIIHFSGQSVTPAAPAAWQDNGRDTPLVPRPDQAAGAATPDRSASTRKAPRSDSHAPRSSLPATFSAWLPWLRPE